jgi:hypothetical protein
VERFPRPLQSLAQLADPALAHAELPGRITGAVSEGQDLLDGSLGVRARRRLEASEDYEELKLLARCDRNGREQGVRTPDLVEAIEYLRELARTCGE